ncbi:hypothetical protein LJC45_02035 [Alistipes sp. OttesenSCG-928-B03]|nr:hypothetical protein [Alistipes sp. OttesenSCG-928-B03]
MSKFSTLLAVALALCLAAGVVRMRAVCRDRDRLQANQRALFDEAREYRLRDSLNAATVGVLTLRLDEFRRGFGEMSALVRDMNVKLRRVESLSQNALESRYEITAPVRDTLMASWDDGGGHAGGYAEEVEDRGDPRREDAGGGLASRSVGQSGGGLYDRSGEQSDERLGSSGGGQSGGGDDRGGWQSGGGLGNRSVGQSGGGLDNSGVGQSGRVSEAGIRAVAVRYRDRYISLDGVITDSVFRGSVVTYDTLTQVVHRVPRRFLFFRYGTRELRQEIVSSNPHTRISYSRSINIEKR